MERKILKSYAFLLAMLAFISVISLAGAANESYNYVWNQSCVGGSCWIPWIATSEGKPKVDLNLYNVSAGNAQFSGNITVSGNVNISGKYYGDGSELTGVSGGSGAGNDTYNYIVNESSGEWTGMRGNTKGVLKIDLTDTSINRLYTNAIGTNLNLSGYLNILGNLNVSGTSYLGSIVISADNITTNSILSKGGNVTFYNNAGSAIMIMTSDGKVGIGTLNPSEKLNVKGSLRVDNLTGSAILYVNSTSKAIGIGTDSVALSRIDTNRALIRTQSANNATELIISPNAGSFGNFTELGAGVASVGLAITASDPYNPIGNNVWEVFDINAYPRDRFAFRVSQWQGTLRPLTFEFGTTEVMRITPTGNVGIGTRSPAAKLHVNVSTVGGSDSSFAKLIVEANEANAGISIKTPNTGTGYLFFTDQDAVYPGFMAYGHGDNHFEFVNPAGQVLKIDSSGRVTTPSQTRVRAKMTASQENLVNLVWTNVSINTTSGSRRYDVGNNFNITSYTFTAPVTGYYHFSGVVDFINVVAGLKRYLARIYVNGNTEYGVSYGWGDGNVGSETHTMVSTTIYLNAGDYAVLQALSYSGDNTVDITTGNTYLNIDLLG